MSGMHELSVTQSILDIALRHGEKAGAEAEAAFDRVFVARQAPTEVPELTLAGTQARLLEVIVQAGFASSNSEARRLVRQGGVSLDGERVVDENLELQGAALGEGLLKVGKRRFVQLRFSG